MLRKTPKNDQISKNTHFKAIFKSVINIDITKMKNISKQKYIGRFNT